MGGARRKPTRNSGKRRLYAGDVAAKIKFVSSGSHRQPDNAVPFSYSTEPSDDPSRLIHLTSSSIVAFVDPTPSSHFETPAYSYDPAVADGFGLGFHNNEPQPEREAEEEEEEKEEEESEGKGGDGFLSIGGVRIYTEDTSSPEEDDVSGGEDEDSTGSENSSEEEGESSDGSSSDDDDAYNEDFGIDEEIAGDYLEGIGGSGELMKSKWMAKRNLEEEFLDFESSSDGEDGGKLGPLDLMNVSREYGMLEKEKKKRREVKTRKEVKTRREKVEFRLSAAMDDLVFEKDARMVSGRDKKKKKDGSELSKSWPRVGGRSRDYYGIPGMILEYLLDNLLL